MLLPIAILILLTKTSVICISISRMMPHTAKTLIATRFYGELKYEDIVSLRRFRDSFHAKDYESLSLLMTIAIDGNDSKLEASLISHFPTIHIVKVLPYSAYSASLNALIKYGKSMQCTHFYIQSMEVEGVSQVHLRIALNEMEKDGYFVVGMNLIEREWSKDIGSVELTGMNSPWNTAALWNLHELSKTGFLPISDDHRGMEV